MKRGRNDGRLSGRRLRRPLPGLLLFLLLAPGCGGGAAALFAGGGIGGTGLSTGVILAFGSVHVNGIEFLTDDNTVKLVNDVDDTGLPDNVAFHVGMVVSVRHGADDNNAGEIDYDGNLKGPVGVKNPVDNTLTVLGHTIAVDGQTRFDPSTTDFAAIVNNVVEVSGLIDSAGRIRATYLKVEDHGPRPGDEYRVRGYVSGISPADGTFRLGPLPGVDRLTVRFSVVGLSNGDFVDVRTLDQAPDAGNAIAATRVEVQSDRFAAPDGTKASFEGLVTSGPVASGTGVLFELEGKPVQTSNATFFPNGTAADILPNVRLQAEGTLSGGILAAEKITFR